MAFPPAIWHRTGDNEVLPGDQFNNGFGGHYPFTITTSDAWLTITDSSSNGTAGDTVAWTVAPYSGSVVRSGTITFHIASSPPSVQTQTQYQIGVPTFQLSANSVTVPASGGTVGPTIIQDGTQSTAPPIAPTAFAVGWTATDPDAWITLNPVVGHPFGGFSTVTSNIFNWPLSVSVAPNSPTGAARTSVVTVIVNSAGSAPSGPFDPNYLYSGTLANDWLPIGLLTYTINQDAGPDWVDPGGGGTPIVGFPGTGYRNPFNLPEQWGYYLRSGVATTGIGGFSNAVCLRANKVAPFGNFDDVGAITNTGDANDPRIAYMTSIRRLFATYLHNADTYIAYSDDDGHSWAGRTVHIAGGKHPTIVAAGDRTLVTVSYLAPVGTATYGTLQAKLWGPGDSAFGSLYTLKDDSGNPLQPKDDSFHLISRHAGERTWFLIGVFGTDSGPSVWSSADPDASTWTREQTVLSGGKHPTIAEGLDRTLIAAAYFSPTGTDTYGKIKISLRGPGDATFGTPYTLQDQTGHDLFVLDDSFHLSQPPAGQRLWVWALMVGGDGGCSEWSSGEPDTKSVTRVV